MNSPRESPKRIDQGFLDQIGERLSQNQRIRRKLPGDGRLHIERQLPFFCVYRRPAGPDAGADRLTVSGASYLIAGPRHSARIGALVRQIAAALAQRFRACLIVEIWSAPAELPARPDRAAFRVFSSKAHVRSPIVETLEKALKEIPIRRHESDVTVVSQNRIAPPRRPPLLTAAQARELNCVLIGLEVQPIFRHASTGELRLRVLRPLRRGVDRALKKTYFAFSCTQTSHRPEYYFAVSPGAINKTALEVDRALAAVGDSFDLLLQVTPVNAEIAWKEFRRQRYEETPIFQYRPLAVEPALLKRALFAVPVERVKDATLSQLFREKQDELDRQITMLADVGTPNFLHGSLQLYQAVEDGLLVAATDILDKLKPPGRENSRRRSLSATEFATEAEADILQYRQRHADFWATVHVRDDIYSGLLCSQGRLLVGCETRIPAARVRALISHEVGTHLVTYFNGLAQPIRQLHTGLPGYDELQEGLAVLSEYLVGGLSRARLRLLAARVLATRLLIDGTSFVDTYRTLVEGYGFPQRVAFTITMRIYRGGGFTKDAVYLRGLVKVLDYLHEGGELDPLMIGKIAAAHVPLIQELRLREVLHAPPLVPHYLQDPQALLRIERLRKGLRLLDLVEE